MEKPRSTTDCNASEQGGGGGGRGGEEGGGGGEKKKRRKRRRGTKKTSVAAKIETMISIYKTVSFHRPEHDRSRTLMFLLVNSVVLGSVLN